MAIARPITRMSLHVAMHGAPVAGINEQALRICSTMRPSARVSDPPRGEAPMPPRSRAMQVVGSQARRPEAAHVGGHVAGRRIGELRNLRTDLLVFHRLIAVDRKAAVDRTAAGPARRLVRAASGVHGSVTGSLGKSRKPAFGNPTGACRGRCRLTERRRIVRRATAGTTLIWAT